MKISGENSDEAPVVQLVKAINLMLLTGRLPTDLPEDFLKIPGVHEIIDHLNNLNVFALALANGNLDQELYLRGKIAGALKSFHANLRHLTWQTQQIASGDLTQRVAFMGEFSTAFNTMVNHLQQSREMLEQRAVELAEQSQTALNLMMETQESRKQLEVVNQQLHQQLVEIQRLQDILKEQAIRDQLTGLFNRRYFDETLFRELERAKRECYPVCIIMIDIDHFKRLNDDYGHHVGDMVLRMIGKLLIDHTRKSDAPCRYGGEELILILPNICLDNAIERAERLRSVFESASVIECGITIKATFSAGVGCYPEHGTFSDELLKSVDVALYRAKENGRNRVVVAVPFSL